MISPEKWMILTSLQKLPNNVGDLGKIIIATGFEWLPNVQKIAQSGHTACGAQFFRHIIGKHRNSPLGQIQPSSHFNKELYDQSHISYVYFRKVHEIDLSILDTTCAYEEQT